jgi:excisionase family DNA binding protein
MAERLTTKEAAEKLAIHWRSVVKAIHRGTLKAEKHGRDYFITREEVDRYAREVRRQRRERELENSEDAPENHPPE